MDTYKINIEGLDRELRKFPVNDKLDIAAFIMFGDIEMTEVAARELLKRVPEHDVVVTAEAKGIPLCYEMARQGCRNYVVARKSVKVYMGNPIGVTVNSIIYKLNNFYTLIFTLYIFGIKKENSRQNMRTV